MKILSCSLCLFPLWLDVGTAAELENDRRLSQSTSIHAVIESFMPSHTPTLTAAPSTSPDDLPTGESTKRMSRRNMLITVTSALLVAFFLVIFILLAVVSRKRKQPQVQQQKSPLSELAIDDSSSETSMVPTGMFAPLAITTSSSFVYATKADQKELTSPTSLPFIRTRRDIGFGHQSVSSSSSVSVDSNPTSAYMKTSTLESNTTLSSHLSLSSTAPRIVSESEVVPANSRFMKQVRFSLENMIQTYSRDRVDDGQEEVDVAQHTSTCARWAGPVAQDTQSSNYVSDDSDHSDTPFAQRSLCRVDFLSCAVASPKSTTAKESKKADSLGNPSYHSSEGHTLSVSAASSEEPSERVRQGVAQRYIDTSLLQKDFHRTQSPITTVSSVEDNARSSVCIVEEKEETESRARGSLVLFTSPLYPSIVPAHALVDEESTLFSNSTLFTHESNEAKFATDMGDTGEI